MKKSELIKTVREELRGWSPQVGHTKGLTPKTLNKILMKIASGDDWEPDNEVEEKLKEAFAQLEGEKPGLWANIRAKRERGEKPAHKNSKAHKDAVAAGKKINTMSEDKADAIRWFGNLKYYYQKAFAELKGEDRETYKQLAKEFFSKLEIDQLVRPVGLNENEDWPQGTQSRYQEYSFKLIKVMPDRAKYSVTDMETGELKGTVVFNTVDQLHDYAADLIRPQGGRQSSHFGTNEGEEENIVKDILSGLNEGKLDGVLDKMKQYAKKGLLTLAVLASVTQGLQAQGVPQGDIDAVNQQGIELVQQDSTVSRMTERLIVQNLGQQKFDALVKLAKENGLRLGAGKGRSLSMAQSQSRLNALSGINGEVTTQVVDSQTMKTSDGQYFVVQFLKVTIK